MTNRRSNVPSNAPRNTADHNAASTHTRHTPGASLSLTLGVFSLATSVWYESVLWCPSNGLVSSSGVVLPDMKVGGCCSVHSLLKSRAAVLFGVCDADFRMEGLVWRMQDNGPKSSRQAQRTGGVIRYKRTVDAFVGVRNPNTSGGVEIPVTDQSFFSIPSHGCKPQTTVPRPMCGPDPFLFA